MQKITSAEDTEGVTGPKAQQEGIQQIRTMMKVPQLCCVSLEQVMWVRCTHLDAERCTHVQSIQLGEREPAVSRRQRDDTVHMWGCNACSAPE